MDAIIINFLTFILLMIILLFALNSYQTFRLKSLVLRPLVKMAGQKALEKSFDFLADKMAVKPEEFTKSFSDAFYEEAKTKAPRAAIEKVQVTSGSDQHIIICVKAPGLLFQEVKYVFATLSGSNSVWGITGELGLLDYYLRERTAALRKKLEEEKAVHDQVVEQITKAIPELPVAHILGQLKYNWDKILTELYNIGENSLYDLVKNNYNLLSSYEERSLK